MCIASTTRIGFFWAFLLRFQGKALLLFFLLICLTYQLKSQLPQEIDVQIAHDYGITPVYFNQTALFVTPSGNQYNISMAVITVNDTVAGGDMSGYAIAENITQQQAMVLLDSLPNTCFSVFSLSNFIPELYAQSVSDHWAACGYFLTSINVGDSFMTDDLFVCAPNPISSSDHHILTIRFNRPILSLSIRNVHGDFIDMMYPAFLFEQSMQINLEQFNSGVYFLSVESSDGLIETKKLLKL